MGVHAEIRACAAELTGRRHERAALDGLLDACRVGRSRALVLRGDPGVGKTALLGYLVGQASDFRIARAVGVQSEMELAFGGLHQLLAPLLEQLQSLPRPQRDALGTAFGIADGPPPARLHVALAALGLLSECAAERPLLCVVDDEQWLDRASAQILAFIARRLEAESVGLVFAARATSAEMVGVPELTVEGMDEDDASELLDSVLAAPLDARIREQLVSETRGNPLAIVEAIRGLTPAELAGGFRVPGGVTRAIEAEYRRRLEALPAETRLLLTVAAADPTGEPLLVWRAAAMLGVEREALSPASDAGLLDIAGRVRFRHPLVRSLVYESAARPERRRAHRALADASNPNTDPDRRAWHRAYGSPGPDDAIAGELERAAGRALARGGLAAAAAFLERAAAMTLDLADRRRRLLAAATGKRDAGAFDPALRLLAALEAGPTDALDVAEIDHLRGQIALEQQHGGEAVPLLLRAAKRFEPLRVDLARDAHLEALTATIWAGDLDNPGAMRAAAEAARDAPPAAGEPRPSDALLDGLALRLTAGYPAAAPALKLALRLVVAAPDNGTDVGSTTLIATPRPSALIAMELWDPDSWYAISARLLGAARESGALSQLRLALHLAAGPRIAAGELLEAAALLREDRLIAHATGNTEVPYTEAWLTAVAGDEDEAVPLIDAAAREARLRGLGQFVAIASCARAILNNGLGRHPQACAAAREAFQLDHVGLGPLVTPELVEGAVRSGDLASAHSAVAFMRERVAVTQSAWLLGIEARAGALLSKGKDAENRYRASIEHLSDPRTRLELARSHLLYGEWLRRERRRADARTELRTAYDMLSTMGAAAFAERARRELLATGETVRKRVAQTRDDLTPTEEQIARLARDGLSNPEIATRLFISPRTVQYHLGKVFTKLGVRSRSQLGSVLPDAQGVTESSP
jgi:DNA-binding CsgD family transcriptional regulator